MSLDDYLKDIARVPMLTCDEEIILGNRVREMIRVLRSNGLDERILRNNIFGSMKSLQPETRQVVKKGLKARDRIISANMRLVVAVAKRMKTGQVNMSMQDLIQEGAIGLARAAEKFEPGRGYKFSTYAYWWIRQAVARATEYQEKAIRIPVNVQKTAKQVAEVQAKLSAKLGKKPTILEIAEEMDEKPERIEKILLLNATVISLDRAPEAEAGQFFLVDAASCLHEEEIKELEELSIRAEFATKLVNALPREDQELIKKRYGIGMDPMTIKEIAEASGVSQQYVKQRHQKILSKIKLVANIFASAELG